MVRECEALCFSIMSSSLYQPLFPDKLVNRYYTITSLITITQLTIERPKKGNLRREKNNLSVFANLIDFYKVLNPDWAGP